MKICYIVAMEAEAAPFVERYQVEKVEGFFSPLPCLLYRKELPGGHSLYVVIHGTQHGSSLVGCEVASLTAVKAIEMLHPDIVINSGTCGAFNSKGAEIGKVYIGHSVMFHDRRVMGDDEWGTQTLGNYPLAVLSADVAGALHLPMGKVTTGSSLDMQPCDLKIIEENNGELKDMEAAAIAFVCSLYGVPCMLVKAVTDLVDSGADTFEEFCQNLRKASEALSIENNRIVDYLVKGGKAE